MYLIPTLYLRHSKPSSMSASILTDTAVINILVNMKSVQMSTVTPYCLSHCFDLHQLFYPRNWINHCNRWTFGGKISHHFIIINKHSFHSRKNIHQTQWSSPELSPSVNGNLVKYQRDRWQAANSPAMINCSTARVSQQLLTLSTWGKQIWKFADWLGKTARVRVAGSKECAGQLLW